MVLALLLACAPVVLRTEPPGAWVAVDGAEPVPAPVALRPRPWGHRVVVTREGYRTVTLRAARLRPWRRLAWPGPEGADPGILVLLVPDHGPAGTWTADEVR